MSTSGLLEERHTTHGDFRDNARVGQHLRAFWRAQPTWNAMPEEHREALDHLAGKLSRIFSGQSMFPDHWADIAGYAVLAEKACQCIQVDRVGPGIEIPEPE
jgi:hypothetical protein